jgi:hypothetical protein
LEKFLARDVVAYPGGYEMSARGFISGVAHVSSSSLGGASFGGPP